MSEVQTGDPGPHRRAPEGGPDVRRLPRSSPAVRSCATTPSIARRRLTSRRSGHGSRASSSTWFQPPTKGLEWTPPHCTWFADGVLNVSYNCLDKHVAAGRGDKVAYHWEAEAPGRDADDLLRRAPAGRLAARQRAQGPRRGQGRSRRDLHGNDPGASGRDARVRADRRSSHRRLRRLLRRVARRSACATPGRRFSSRRTRAGGRVARCP